MTTADRANLYQIYNLLGWEVLERLFAEEEQQLAGEWISADPANQQAVWAAQAVAHGYHVGVGNVFTRIKGEIEAYRESLKNPKKDLDEEYLRSITSPFGGLPEVQFGRAERGTAEI